MSAMAKVQPVILSGGAGSRLWPLSRETYPKQLIGLVGDDSLFEQTLARFQDRPEFSPPILVGGEAHRFLLAEQLRRRGIEPRAILLEPEGRNTAMAVCVAMMEVARDDPEAIVFVVPSDHRVGLPDALSAAVRAAIPVVRDGAIMIFGATADRPETGYGYIKAGAPNALEPSARAVDRFIEKPDRERAETMLREGGHYWNCGMFLMRADVALAEFRAHAPEVAAAAAAAIEESAVDLDFRRLGANAYASAPKLPFDVAIMEKTDRAVVIPVDMDWDDIGSWSALWKLGARDGADNVLVGDVWVNGCEGSYVDSRGQFVAAVGLENMVVVATPDAILVADRERVQDVRAVADWLKTQDRPEAREHRRVPRPWGSYESLASGERFQVKRIIVSPGRRLSAQMHYHRAEHWVVVRGTARVEQGDRSFLLGENESAYIPAGTRHRLENPGKVPLIMIEIQSGAYLGEDDIVRFEDDFGRGPKG